MPWVIGAVCYMAWIHLGSACGMYGKTKSCTLKFNNLIPSQQMTLMQGVKVILILYLCYLIFTKYRPALTCMFLSGRKSRCLKLNQLCVNVIEIEINIPAKVKAERSGKLITGLRFKPAFDQQHFFLHHFSGIDETKQNKKNGYTEKGRFPQCSFDHMCSFTSVCAYSFACTWFDLQKMNGDCNLCLFSCVWVDIG